MACCQPLYYCTTAGRVTVLPDPDGHYAKPPGYRSGPFLTEEEAGEVCPVVQDCDSLCPPVQMPGLMTASFVNKTGVCTCLPNSMSMLYRPVDSIFWVYVLSPPQPLFAWAPPFLPTGVGSFKANKLCTGFHNFFAWFSNVFGVCYFNVVVLAFNNSQVPTFGAGIYQSVRCPSASSGGPILISAGIPGVPNGGPGSPGTFDLYFEW